ncbi:MAG: hypothetical protein JPMHGGIA_02211 [Saprospiraceae bacterium]|nr:hypothetical protein [Saprospiraceae bacterium]
MDIETSTPISPVLLRHLSGFNVAPGSPMRLVLKTEWREVPFAVHCNMVTRHPPCTNDAVNTL